MPIIKTYNVEIICSSNIEWTITYKKFNSILRKFKGLGELSLDLASVVSKNDYQGIRLQCDEEFLFCCNGIAIRKTGAVITLKSDPYRILENEVIKTIPENLYKYGLSLVSNS